MLEEQLEKFGLSDKEAKAYLALLEQGESSVNAIAKESGVNRSSMYTVLKSLEDKGLTASSISKGVQVFKASPPEKLGQIAEDQLRKHLDAVESIQKIIPDLKATHKDTRNKPKVKIFEGKEGIIASFEDTLSAKEKIIRVVSSASRLSRLLPTYFRGYVRRRKEIGLKMIGIHPDELIGRTLMRLGAVDFDDPVLIPKDEFKFAADFAIYDDKIAYTIARDGGVAVIIESREVAEISKTIFDLAFKEAKRIKKENE